MKTTIDYSNDPAPMHKAVEDIKDYLGDAYDNAAEVVKRLESRELFSQVCGFMGIEGLPVRAWYDHFHGEGAFAKESEL